MNDSSQRFDTIASNYAQSEVHRSSPTLRRLGALLPARLDGPVCDVACGAGHTGLHFVARGDGGLVAVDPSPAMLQATRGQAAAAGVPVETVHAFAEDIPLPDGRFALVVSRLAPHHFHDIDAAVGELARICRPGGFVAVIDLQGDADPRLDGLNHQLEVLHDPTHVRSYTVQAWRELVARAGLQLETVEADCTEKPDGVPLSRWCAIASSGAPALAALQTLLDHSDPDDLAAIGVRRDAEGTWRMPVRTCLVLARKPEAAPCH